MSDNPHSESLLPASLRDSFVHVQMRLFPILEDEFGKLDDDHRQFVALCQTVEPLFPHGEFAWCGNGRPPVPRLWLLRAFLAKALWNFPTTRALIEELGARPKMRRLCGFDMPGDVPGEWTFSRAFKVFARNKTAQRILARFTDRAFEGVPVHHESIDSTAIHSWEKAAKDKPEKPEEPRLETQPGRTAEENEADLPTQCDWGVKRNSKGVRETWRGYKLHAAVSDGDVPTAMIVTSASVHDSQVAIPLMQRTRESCTVLYDLLDAGYDAEPIRDFSRSLGSVPIIPVNPRGRGEGNGPEMEPDRAERFRRRSGVERFNSHLNDEHGGRTVRVRGHAKVALHLAFGVLVIAVEQVFRLLE